MSPNHPFLSVSAHPPKKIANKTSAAFYVIRLWSGFSLTMDGEHVVMTVFACSPWRESWVPAPLEQPAPWAWASQGWEEVKHLSGGWYGQLCPSNMTHYSGLWARAAFSIIGCLSKSLDLLKSGLCYKPGSYEASGTFFMAFKSIIDFFLILMNIKS